MPGVAGCLDLRTGARLPGAGDTRRDSPTAAVSPPPRPCVTSSLTRELSSTAEAAIYRLPTWLRITLSTWSASSSSVPLFISWPSFHLSAWAGWREITRRLHEKPGDWLQSESHLEMALLLINKIKMFKVSWNFRKVYIYDLYGPSKSKQGWMSIRC